MKLYPCGSVRALRFETPLRLLLHAKPDYNYTFMNLANNDAAHSDINVLESTRFASYLFLQGPASMFFSELAGSLRERGHRVWRINFNGGDRAFWRQPGGIDYLGGEAQFLAFVLRQFSERGITDLVLLGDCRPLHRLAIEAAGFFGVRTHIFEEGYIRPNWITLEQTGVNGFSALPRDIEVFLREAGQLAAAPVPFEFPSKLSLRALDDVIYSVSTMLLAWRYAKYQRHWPYGQLSEYFYGGRRLMARILKGRRYDGAIADIINGDTDYYVFPMQVDVDSQIIFHSQFKGQADAIALILKSFAEHAPAGALLVITEHPLETSPTNWRRLVNRQAEAFGVGARIKFIPGGSPRELLQSARGIVVVNSTTGHQALELGVPVIALSPAIFNLTGITFQAGLDRFWREAGVADADLFDAYRKVVICKTQINGSFFGKKGIASAVANAVPVMELQSRGGAVPAAGERPIKSGVPMRIPDVARQEKFT